MMSFGDKMTGSNPAFSLFQHNDDIYTAVDSLRSQMSAGCGGFREKPQSRCDYNGSSHRACTCPRVASKTQLSRDLDPQLTPHRRST